jgi:hypothetical protein
MDVKNKRKNEGINKRKDTLIKKAYELRQFDGVNVALIICKHGRYTTYKSRDHKTWPPFMVEIVSNCSLICTTSVNIDLINRLSSPEKHVIKRYREAHL